VGEKWGFIDKKGKFVINPQFGDIVPEVARVLPAYYSYGLSSECGFSEGLAAVEVVEGWGYVNKEGKFIINPQFDDAMPFSEGLAGVKIGGNFGFIDKSGKYVINPQFDLRFHSMKD